MGGRGHSYDNAVAESVNGLYKAELIYHKAPWKTRAAVGLQPWNGDPGSIITDYLNPSVIFPPAKAEAYYYQQLAQKAMVEV